MRKRHTYICVCVCVCGCVYVYMCIHVYTCVYMCFRIRVSLESRKTRREACHVRRVVPLSAMALDYYTPMSGRVINCGCVSPNELFSERK